jgi:hypothetical protein
MRFRLSITPMHLLLIAVCLLTGIALASSTLTPPTAQAQNASRTGPVASADPFVVLNASSFWINGTTTVNAFTCRVEDVRGSGQVPRVPASAVPVSLDQSPSLDVPVREFDCGNKRMSKDLREALHAEAHPTIQFRLENVERITRPTDASHDWYRLDVVGALTIAGTERRVQISAWGRPVTGEVYRVSGCKDLQMTAFGIDPPTKFLSLIKVRNDIEVHFDLLVETRQTTSSALASHSLSNPPQCPDE